MNKKIIKLVQYLTNLSLLLSSTFALADNASQYITYNNLLFDRDGTVIIDNSQKINSITYKDHYWIVQLTNSSDSLLYSNIRKIDNFKFAFEKKGDILKFKTIDTLTYLGEERIAYYYQDTKLSVVIDTDGNLITPKGRYYLEIGPFINGYAEVTTPEYDEGYLNLQGKFFKKLPKTTLTQKTQSQTKPQCKIITSDTIMQLCKKNNSQYLVNSKTGKETDVGSKAWTTNFDCIPKNLSAGYFWLGNYQDGYHVYQIYDYDGKMHYQNQYYAVSPLYGTASWVQDSDNSKKRLIDITGKTIGEYNNYTLLQVGTEKLYYAQKTTPKNKDKNSDSDNDNDKQILLSIFDVNGNILLYEDIVGSEQNSHCHRDVKVLKNAENKIVWPTDLERECLLDRYIQSAKTDNDNSYRHKKQESKAIEIPKDKVPEISRYFTQIQSNKNTNPFTFEKGDIYLTGPNTTKIEGIAELSIPEGYIYSEKYNPSNTEHCDRFVAPAYDNQNRLCINVYKLGFIDLLEVKKLFDDKTNIENLKTKISSRIEDYKEYKDYQKFEWLIDPEFDFENQSLKFGYRYHIAESDQNRTSQIIEYIKFAKDHIIVFKNDYYDDYNDFKPMEFDWLNRIKVFEKADISSTYPCSKLSIKDSALSANKFIYLDKEFCFPLPITTLFEKYPTQTELNSYHELFSFRENRYPIKEGKTLWN
ncbi:hypothetical protein [Gilliamella sp. ESL0254]|uniref:hypothetical protein n=1 Tax=Gilliamella sp. ESL0254 TaxID=2705035 RepID=UPI0015809BE9|nr:hypothetical protein [Gilliamella sp. ESL0254]NUF28375.1 hypothetical protein [Gilliamella sp. ESL0254]